MDKHAPENAITGKRRYGLAARSMRVLPVVLAVVGVLFSILLMQARLRWERRRLRNAFEGEARNVGQAVEREFALYLEVLKSLGRLHAVSGDVDQAAFEEFVDKGLIYHRHILGAFGWAARVPDVQRQLYEIAMRSTGKTGFTLLQDYGGTPGPAGKREVYYPVSYTSPSDIPGLPVGYDLASCPEYLVAMIEARDSGEPTVSRARKVSGGRDLGPARLVFLPTFTMEAASVDAAGRAFHSGTVFAVLDPRSLLSRILTAVNVSTLNVRVEEFREPMEWRTIYANTLTVDKPPNAGDPGGLLYAGDLNLPGVTWRLVCSPTQGLVDRYHTGLPWALLGAGIVFTVLLTAYVALLSGHAVQVEQEVRKRTTQLQQANRELRAGFNERRRLEQEILDVGTLEKRRIGQDLHDSLAQQLTGIGLMSKVLARELAEADPVHADQAEKVSSAMKDARAMVRRIARGLTPVELDAEGLCDALQQLVEDTMSLYDLKCELMMDAACMIYSDQQAMHLYHIAQEAVNNAARHAGAGHVVIRLSGGPRDGMMSVEDDGSGIDERLAGKTGLGLRTMRYRAEIIGGRLDIQPRETGGTRVVCRFVTDQDKPGHPT